jgi:hypothetical protein
MMYVNDLRVDSICDTWPAFFVTKSAYMCSHSGGRESTLPMLDFRAKPDGFPGISAGVDIVTASIC